MIVGIDPGCNETGLVLRDVDQCVRAITVIRAELADGDYITEVMEAVAELVQDSDTEIVAVEGLVSEELYHGSFKNPGPIIKAAMVLGGVLARFPGAVVVPPGGNGAGPMSAYPESLRPTRGSGKGHDGLRHMRSAWDVAGIRPSMIRTVTNA